MIRSCTRGFTLMEMLLVTVLVSMTGAAVFSAFNNGLKLWRYSAQLTNEQDAAIALDRIGSDLRAVLPVSAINFNGTAMQMSFPAIILAPADKKSARASESLADQIGAVQYRFDPAERKILRRQATYGQALKKQWGPEQEVAKGIDELVFQYYEGDQKEEAVKSSIEAKVPAGVMMQMHIQGEGPDRRLKRYFAIPVGE